MSVTPNQDAFTTAAALTLALSVSERQAWPNLDVTDEGIARASAWRAQSPFDLPEVWRRRLASEDLSFDELSRLLSMSSGFIDPRSVTAGLPPDLQQLGERIQESAQLPPGSSAFVFLQLAAPLLTESYDSTLRWMEESLADIANVDSVMADLFQALGRQVNDMLTRAAILELNLARLAGELSGADSRQRFDSFVARLAQPGYRRGFFEKYPVLARQIQLTASNWARASTTMLQRLKTDYKSLQTFSGAGANLGELIGLDPGLGDRHYGGQTVTRLRFSSGTVLIYKPRSLAIDSHFSALVEWLNRRIELSLKTVESLERADYGWQREIKHSLCTSPAEVPRFYRRLGSFLALLYMMSANDFHSENLIAVGEHPYLIDLESLAQPVLSLRDTRLLDLEEAVSSLTAHSVLRVGLLPNRGWEQVGRAGADISGIGGWAGQQGGLKAPFIVDAGTDVMHIELRTGETPGASNQPAADLRPRELIQFSDDVVAGFTDAYRVILAFQQELLAPNGPIAAFADDSVRVLVRHTIHYGVLQMASYHPDVLVDSLDRERLYDRLWLDAKNVPTLDKFIPAERADLKNNDIPVFTVALTGTEINTSTGIPITGVVTKTGLQAVRDRVESLSDQDLTHQAWLIRASLAAAATDLSPSLVYPSYPLDRPLANKEMPSARDLIEEADRIGQHLLALAYRASGQAEWLGVNSSRGQSWSVGALGPDLYHGLTGIAVFLAALGHATDEDSYRAAAREAMATVELQIARRTLDGLGGVSGYPGYVYGRALVQRLLSDDRSIELTEADIDALLVVVELDNEFDVGSGSAGTILQLRQFQAPRPGLLRIIVAAADGLCATQGPTGGWLAESMRGAGLAEQPLAGLAHGAAGVSWALIEAHRLTGDARYLAAAERAIAYEQTLFDPAVENWQDMRDPFILTGERDAPRPDPITAWCHGAAGIGLARARCLPLIPDHSGMTAQVEAAASKIISAGFGQNHSLCHGDLGNIDMLRQIAAQQKSPDLHLAADHALARTAHSLRLEGWLCGMPQGVETPGLMTGLAGIGYGLLRASAPDAYPSVLSYDLAV